MRRVEYPHASPPGQQPHHDPHPRAIRRQELGPGAETGLVLGVVADGVAGVADLAAGAGVEADDAAGVPLGDVRAVAAEAEIQAAARGAAPRGLIAVLEEIA